MHKSTLFFRCLCYCLFRIPCVGTLRFYGFFHCVWGPCVWGLWDFTFFSTVCGAPVSGDFEILRFLPVCCVRLLCVGTLRIYVFSLCVGPLCVGTLRIYVFFPCVWGHCVCGLWEFTFFSPVCGATVCVGGGYGLWDFTVFSPVWALCVRTLRFYGFLPYVWGPCVYGDFEILHFFPVCGPCVGDFEIFRKNPHREKSRVWGFEMAVTQRKKIVGNLIQVIYYTLFEFIHWWIGQHYYVV